MIVQKVVQISIIYSVFFVYVICTLVSCTNDKLTIIESTCPEEVSYSIQVKEIIDETCAYSGCHDSAGNAPGDFTSYNRMESFLTDNLFESRTLNQRDMPPNYSTGPKSLTQEQIDMLVCWMDNNYKD